MNDRSQPEQKQENLSALIEGIVQDASREAEKVLADAKKSASDRRKVADSQAAAIRKEGEELARRQAEEIASSQERTIAVELRRTRLRLREEMIARTLEGVRARLAALVGKPEYRQILADWITEAAIGLNAPGAEVNASKVERELIDNRLLRDAEKQVLKESGVEVALTLAEAPPHSLQGVTLTASDGRTAFNNQVETRLLRYQSEIRKIIHDRLFT
jgi:vacuolar-type H+-ATPase subunit E/Vma4